MQIGACRLGIAIVAADLGGGHGGVPAQPGAVHADPLVGGGFRRPLQIQALLPAGLQSFNCGADFDATVDNASFNHDGFNNGIYCNCGGFNDGTYDDGFNKLTYARR